MTKTRIQECDSISKYIVCIEGIDGCGKDTQLKLLADKGYYVTGEPDYSSPIGNLLHDILSKKIAPRSKSTIEYLFAADRTEHIEAMKEHVKSNSDPKSKLCITGRYKYSGLVYTEVPKITYYLNSDMPEAGLFIFLEIDPEKAISRIAKRDFGSRELYENVEKLTTVNDEFSKIIRRFKTETEAINGDKIFPEVVIINAELSQEEIHNQIIHTIEDYIASKL